jgi:alpha-2-macroglobulin
MPITNIRCLALVLICLGACKRSDEHETPGQSVSPDTVVLQSTAGTISRASLIEVRFKQPMVDTDKVGTPIEESIFTLTPEVKGMAYWGTTDTLQFKPNVPLDSNQNYQVKVDLRAYTGAGGEEIFRFNFKVMPPSFDVSFQGFHTDESNSNEQRFKGRLTTADMALPTAVEAVLSANQEGRALEIEWQHNAQQTLHEFQVLGIERGTKDSTLTIEWDGQSIDVDMKSKRDFSVAGRGVFRVDQVRAKTGKERHIEVRFSDPLRRKQNFRGLVKADGFPKLRFSTDGNLLKVYSAKTFRSEVKLTVQPGVRNSSGNKLGKKHISKVLFQRSRPGIAFASKGVILPTTQGSILPIKARNLKSIRVQATHVFEENLLQFLQVNELGGTSELSRVGKLVWKDQVVFKDDDVVDNQWHRHGLDLAPLLKKHPRGLYHLTLSFGRGDIVYNCPDNTATRSEGDKPASSPWFGGDGEESSWDNSANNMIDHQDAWRNREDPCHPGFYQFETQKFQRSRNVLVTNIGLVVKKGQDNSLSVAVADLRTAAPIQNATVKLYDYQQQVLKIQTTDGAGLVQIESNTKQPFAITAEFEGQVGIVKLDPGNSLALGHFDVSGVAVSEGIKGKIYGERGVWRPGDDIYLTFVLHDVQKRLPKRHPVSFELVGPEGQVVDRQTRLSSVNGFYRFKTSTAADAPTGEYRARVKVGGTSFHETLTIETVKPNRLKIEVDFGTDLVAAPNTKIAATLKSEWLHGAPASFLKTDVEVSLAPRKARFERYGDFSFDDLTRKFFTETEPIFEGNLNEQGEVNIKTDLYASSAAPSMLTATFRSRVFESGGDFSVDQFSLPFSPYKRYIGVRTPKGDKARGMLLTDTKHRVDVVAIDARGEKVDGGDVELKLFKINWRWWWEKGAEALADYASNSSYTPVEQGVATIKDGKASWEFEVKYPEWGRYLISAQDKAGKHRSTKIIYIDWPGWAGRAQKDNPGGARVLSFAAEKQKYQVGETITLNIPTSEKGRALVSIENGSRVIKMDWLESTGKETKYSFTATSEMTPNVFANVTLLQPHLQTQNDLPIRLYGVIPISIEDPKTHLNPVIESKDVFEPLATATVKVREEDGRPMTYTLAVVDQGILGLTRFKTPQLWNTFHRREALGVRTWDLYDQIAGAFGAKLETLLAIGGDEDGGDSGKKAKANRFPPMVRFYGPFSLGANKTKAHQVSIPQYIGAVRVMVVAGRDGAYGSASKNVFVRKPLMVLGTMPRVMGPGEEVALPVSVFAIDPKVKNVDLQIQASGVLKLSGTGQRTLKFSGPGDQIVTFKVKAKSKVGIGKVKIIGQSGQEKAVQDIELDVRMPTMPVTDVLAATLDPSEEWTPTIALGNSVGTPDVTLELSKIPPINLEERLNFLIQYPHGCIEQTTSSIFPQLHLSSLLKLSDTQKTAIEKNLKAGIERLQSFQTKDGGFAYWPGEIGADAWGSTYAGDFVVEAEKAGYLVPTDMIDKWKRHQREQAQLWNTQSRGGGLQQAYRLYVLALAQEAELGAMNRLKEKKDLSNPSHWQLAAAYHMAGQKDAALALVDKVGMDVLPYTQLSGTYGSDLRDKAMILEALVLLGKRSEAATVAKDISEGLSSTKWLSTQTIAYSLLAMSRFGKSAGPSADFKAAYVWNGNAAELVSQSPIVQAKLEVRSKKDTALSVINQSNHILFARLIIRGRPKYGTEKAASNGLRLVAEYQTLEGETLDPRKIQQGSDFMVEVKVRNATRGRVLKEIALSHLVAAGWEIRNERMSKSGWGSQSAFDHQDIRDDRVYTYFDLKKGESRTFKLLLNASYVGRYYMPPISVEAMYDASINARLAGQWVEVTREGTPVAER